MTGATTPLGQGFGLLDRLYSGSVYRHPDKEEQAKAELADALQKLSPSEMDEKMRLFQEYWKSHCGGSDFRKVEAELRERVSSLASKKTILSPDSESKRS